jgi:hypothetical protein
MKNKAKSKRSAKSRTKGAAHPSAKLDRPPVGPHAEQSPSPNVVNSHLPTTSAPPPGRADHVNLDPKPSQPAEVDPLAQPGQKIDEHLAQEAAPDQANGAPPRPDAQPADNSQPQEGGLLLPGNGYSPAAGFASHDHVWLEGGFGNQEFKDLRINNNPRISTTVQEFALLFILACHNLTRAKKPTPRIVVGDVFLSTENTVKELLSLKNDFKMQLGAYTWDADAVYRAVHHLRRKIEALKISPVILETLKPFGNRLSVPPDHIHLRINGLPNLPPRS